MEININHCQDIILHIYYHMCWWCHHLLFSFVLVFIPSYLISSHPIPAYSIPSCPFPSHIFPNYTNAGYPILTYSFPGHSFPRHPFLITQYAVIKSPNMNNQQSSPISFAPNNISPSISQTIEFNIIFSFSHYWEIKIDKTSYDRCTMLHLMMNSKSKLWQSVD